MAAATMGAAVACSGTAVAEDTAYAALIMDELMHADPEVRRRGALRVMSYETAPDDVGEVLVNAARVERSRGTYVRMLCALGRVDHADARRLIEAHVRSPDSRVRECAWQSLSRWYERRGEDVDLWEKHRGKYEVAEGFHVEDRTNPAVAYTGLGLLAAGHAVAVATAVVVLERDWGQRAYGMWGVGMIPVVGPFITVAATAGDPGVDASGFAGSERGLHAAMVVSGILQTAGATMAIVGLTMPDVVVRDDGSSVLLSVGPGAVTATWTF